MKFHYKFQNLLGTVYRKGDILFTGDGNCVISPVGNKITVYNLKQNKSNTLSFESYYNYTAIDVSPNGSTLLAVNEKGEAQMISLLTCTVIHKYKFKQQVNAVKFSPDGKYFAACCADIGVSVSTVRRIVQHGAASGGKFSTPAKHRKGRPSKVLDDFDVCAIRQKVHFFYTVKKEVPTIGKLLAQLKKDIDYDGSREHLRKLLKKIGFLYKKCKTNRQALMEKPVIAHKRERYLKIIMDNRNLPEELQKDIIYLDESYIHSSYKLKKCWQSLQTQGFTTDISKGKRWIIVHAGTAKGFVPNALLIFSGVNKQEDYHSEMNQHNFTKWVKEKLIPNVTEPSIIVMDNAPYHSVVLNKAPTSASKVNEIRLWLLENNVPFDVDLRKPSLLELVKKHKPEPEYEIDVILGQHGHTVVRLPPYHCDLNPIELIWALAKRKVASRNVGASDVKKLTEEAFNSITVEDWKNCCEHVKKIELEYYNRGKTLYNDIDSLIIQVGADSSDDDSYIESSDESMSEQVDDTNQGASTSHSEGIEGVEYLDFDLLE